MARDVALIQCGDHWENQQRILPLALALAERGWQPVVMTYSPDQGALFLRSGIDVRPLNLARPRLGGVGALAAGRYYRGVDVDEVVRIESARAPARFASSAARARRRLAIARRIDQLEAVLSLTHPSRVYIWNGLTGEVANSLRWLCARHDLEAHYLERGLLPGSVFVDPEGTNAGSQLHRLPLDQLPHAVPGELRAARHPPRSDLRERAGATGRLIFVPLQVQRDANLLFHAVIPGGMVELVDRVAEAIRGTGAVAVVRRHPEEVDEVVLPPRDQVRYIDDGPVEGWCDAADLVVTVNSTVGLTAVCRGRPVVTLGPAIYTNKALCVEVQPSELGDALNDEATYQPPELGRVDQFLSVLLDCYTARPGHAPALVDQRDPHDGADAGPFNPSGVTPDAVRGRWLRVREAATRAVARFGVETRMQYRDDDRVGLTYRRHEPVDADALRAGVEEMLGAADAAAGAERPLEVVVCPQSREPVVGPRTVLVVDGLLEPHLGWLLGGPPRGVFAHGW